MRNGLLNYFWIFSSFRLDISDESGILHLVVMKLKPKEQVMTSRYDELYAEAIGSLKAFKATGLMGYWTKAKDRLVACGMDLSRVGPQDAELLINHLALRGVH